MPIDPVGDEFEEALVDRVINHRVEDQVGAVLAARDSTEQPFAAMLIETTHIRTGVTMRFMLRYDSVVFEQLAMIVDEMREAMPR